MTVTTLASGSSGNCILVSHGDTRVLVDAGISCRRIRLALAALGTAPQALSAVLITHEHSDHIAGLATLFKQYHLPVYCSPGTGRQLEYRIAFLSEVLTTFEPDIPFVLGDLTVTPFSTLHDAADPVGYTFSAGGHKAAIATDLGSVTPAVEAQVKDAGLLVVEANHDPDLLRDGPYPFYLKQRILGDHGHLSNQACAGLVARAQARTVVLAHLSRENNTPQRAYDTARAALERRGAEIGRDVVLAVAPRDTASATFPV